MRLRDVLEAVGIKEDAVYIGFYGADTHVSGKPGKVPISRGVPMSKALENETLIAWAMNGKHIPWNEAKIHVLSQANSLFQTVCRTQWQRVNLERNPHSKPHETSEQAMAELWLSFSIPVFQSLSGYSVHHGLAG